MISLPHDIPPIQPSDFNLETGPPKWKEVENTVRHARSASAPGPNGVPYKRYKNAPDVLCYLWRLMRIIWRRGIIPKVWQRAGEGCGGHQSIPTNLPSKRWGENLFHCYSTEVIHLPGEEQVQWFIPTEGWYSWVLWLLGAYYSSIIWHQIQAA